MIPCPHFWKFMVDPVTWILGNSRGHAGVTSLVRSCREEPCTNAAATLTFCASFLIAIQFFVKISLGGVPKDCGTDESHLLR